MNTETSSGGTRNYSTHEAAQRLGLGRTNVYRLLKEGRLRAIRVGRRTLIPSTEVDAFIAAELERQHPAAA